MKKNKYRITFYKINGTKFTRICTRTYLSTVKFALKAAFKQRAVFNENLIVDKYVLVHILVNLVLLIV